MNAASRPPHHYPEELCGFANNFACDPTKTGNVLGLHSSIQPMSSFPTNPSVERGCPPLELRKLSDSKQCSGKTYHIQRLYADDPENDTTASEIIFRTTQYYSDKGTLRDAKVCTPEALVAKYHIERTRRRIQDILLRLAHKG